MSGGAFRDDHDAALERADALERELANAREERDAAREERDAARAERDAARAGSDPPRTDDHRVQGAFRVAEHRVQPAAWGVAGVALAILAAAAISLIVALGLSSPSSEEPPAPVPVVYRSHLAEDYHLRGCVVQARERNVPHDQLDLTFVAADDCGRTIAEAATDSRFSADARARLRELALVLAALNASYTRLLHSELDDLSTDSELVSTTAAARRAAAAVPLETMPLDVPPNP